MARRTAARVVPTAEPTASTCSNNSAVVFTPVVPIERAADDRERGAASGSRNREDGQAYVSHLPELHALQSAECGARPFRSELWGAAVYAQHRRGQFFATERADPGESREGS